MMILGQWAPGSDGSTFDPQNTIFGVVYVEWHRITSLCTCVLKYKVIKTEKISILVYSWLLTDGGVVHNYAISFEHDQISWASNYDFINREIRGCKRDTLVTCRLLKVGLTTKSQFSQQFTAVQSRSPILINDITSYISPSKMLFYGWPPYFRCGKCSKWKSKITWLSHIS